VRASARALVQKRKQRQLLPSPAWVVGGLLADLAVDLVPHVDVLDPHGQDGLHVVQPAVLGGGVAHVRHEVLEHRNCTVLGVGSQDAAQEGLGQGHLLRGNVRGGFWFKGFRVWGT
jgi:hypothetical protein